MIEKLIIFINWVIGALAIGFCLVSGSVVGEEGLSQGAVKQTMVSAVEVIARHQEGMRNASGTADFVTFSRNPNDMKKALKVQSVPQGDFTLEAFEDSDAAVGKFLVIRAIVSSESIRNDRAQPLIYQKIIPADGGATRGEWVPLSNVSYGLKLF
jgi:hypothetical protein